MNRLGIAAGAFAVLLGIAGGGVGEPKTVHRLDPPTSLAGDWKFHPGDDPGWAAPAFDDSGWAEIRTPGSWTRQGFPEVDRGWYRHTVALNPALFAGGGELRLGVRVGDVFAAYELYAGGVLVGGAGSLPPDPRMAYDVRRSYAVPTSAVDDDGRLVLALRVWRPSGAARLTRLGGVYAGPLEIGRLEVLERRGLTAELPQLILAVLFAAVGIYHLHLYRRRPELREYLWFALFALDDAAFTFLRSQWRFLLADDFLLLKQLEYLTRYLLPVFAIQFLWPLLWRPIGRWLRAYQLSHVALALLAVLTPGLGFELATVRGWELWILPLPLLMVWLVLKRAWEGDPEARTLSIGVAFLALAYVHDILVGRSVIGGPYLSTFGFALFVFAMALSLANRFSRVHHEVDVLRQDLEKRVAERTRELEQARLRAEAANRAKSIFLGKMSHELRTPLTGILGAAEILERSELDDDQRRFVELVDSSGRELLRRIDDLLHTSQIEAGEVTLEHADFRLVELVRGVVTRLRGQARSKGLELGCRLDDALPAWVHSDPVRLRQLLFHLLDNAIKFTDRGLVELTVSPLAPEDDGGSWIRFAVHDTGVGIELEALAALFEPFAQADDSSSRRFGGSGLGLAICKRIVELMEGRIGADRNGDGGTTFWFEVPLTPAVHRNA